jgi:hypothetical protein
MYQYAGRYSGILIIRNYSNNNYPNIILHLLDKTTEHSHCYILNNSLSNGRKKGPTPLLHPIRTPCIKDVSTNFFNCTMSHLNTVNGKGKGKAIPLQSWTAPEGSSRLRLPDFKTIGT